MFVHIRFQTGELNEIIIEMKKGRIPCMDVDNMDEFNWVIKQLALKNIFLVEDLEFDRYARDRIKESEFEFRAAFSDKSSRSADLETKDLMYIDFYFEPDIEESYDPIGEM